VAAKTGGLTGAAQYDTVNSQKEISRMKRILVLMALCALCALAADISGNWKATADMGGQSMERTFTFKVDGNKVTGETTSSFAGKSTITDGKIEGDTVTFTITVNFGDNPMKLNYKGKVSADGKEIHFTVDNPQGGNTMEWNAKKVS
jgi:hypothetical protein